MAYEYTTYCVRNYYFSSQFTSFQLRSNTTMDTQYKKVSKDVLPTEFGGELDSLATYHNDSGSFITTLVMPPSTMMGKSKVVNTHSNKYYPIRPKIRQQHCHCNGYNNTRIYKYYPIRIKIPEQQTITNQKSKPTTAAYYMDSARHYPCPTQATYLSKSASRNGKLLLFNK